MYFVTRYLQSISILSITVDISKNSLNHFLMIVALVGVASLLTCQRINVDIIV